MENDVAFEHVEKTLIYFSTVAAAAVAWCCRSPLL